MIQKNKNNVLFCFSPAVMLATLVIEMALLFYTLVRYRQTVVVKIASVMLFCLAGFQWAEYNVCTGSSLVGLNWSKIGYVFITLLPALGIHFIYEISKRRSVVPAIAYGVAIAWAGYFIAHPTVFNGTECTGNYVIFQLNYVAAIAYGFYYHGFLLLAMALALQFSKTANATTAKALKYFIGGYLVFIVPTLLINTINPATRQGIPSIMCGFAVVFAVVLSLRVLPLVAKQKDSVGEKKAQ